MEMDFVAHKIEDAAMAAEPYKTEGYRIISKN